MSSMVFERFLRWGAAVAVTLSFAGCGGGGGAGGGGTTETGAVSQQLTPVAAFALAQQAVAAQEAPTAAPAASVNLVANSGFENGMAGWGDWGNTSVVAGQASSGSSALSVGTGAGGAGQWVPGIVPGNTYRLSAQGRVSAPAETAYIGINFVDASGNSFTQNTVLVTSTAYTTASVDVVAPPGAVSALVYVWKNAGSGVAYVDDFDLEVIGHHVPGLASSENLLINGGNQLYGLTAWFNFGNASSASASQAAAGSSAIRVGTGAGGVGQDLRNIVGGGTYRLSALGKVSDPSETGYFGIMFMDDAGNGLRAQSLVFRSTSYEAMQADLTAPPGATKAQVFVWKNAGAGFAFVDEASLVRVAPASIAFTPVAGAPTVLATGNTTARGVAALPGGLRVAGWSDDTGVHTQLVDGRGGLVGSPVAIAPTGTFSGIAALAGGGYAVEYAQPDSVFVQIADATGTLAGAPVVVRTQAQVLADPSYAPHSQQKLAGGAGVYAEPDGGFIAAYRESHFPGHLDTPVIVAARRYDALGSRMEGPKVVGDWSTTLSPRPAGGLITSGITWCGCAGSGRAAFGLYDAALNRVPFQDSVGSLGGDTVGTPDAAGLTNGSYVGIWTVVYAYAGGLPIESQPGQVQGEVSGGARLRIFAGVGAGARVTALAGGGFLLSWGSSAQAFDASGFPASDVVQILDGSIAPTPEGGFVVVAQVGSQLVEQEYAAAP